jgi:hypothetical protein
MSESSGSSVALSELERMEDGSPSPQSRSSEPSSSRSALRSPSPLHSSLPSLVQKSNDAVAPDSATLVLAVSAPAVPAPAAKLVKAKHPTKTAPPPAAQPMTGKVAPESAVKGVGKVTKASSFKAAKAAAKHTDSALVANDAHVAKATGKMTKAAPAKMAKPAETAKTADFSVEETAKAGPPAKPAVKLAKAAAIKPVKTARSVKSVETATETLKAASNVTQVENVTNTAVASTARATDVARGTDSTRNMDATSDVEAAGVENAGKKAGSAKDRKSMKGDGETKAVGVDKTSEPAGDTSAKKSNAVLAVAHTTNHINARAAKATQDAGKKLKQKSAVTAAAAPSKSLSSSSSSNSSSESESKSDDVPIMAARFSATKGAKKGETIVTASALGKDPEVQTELAPTQKRIGRTSKTPGSDTQARTTYATASAAGAAVVSEPELVTGTAPAKRKGRPPKTPASSTPAKLVRSAAEPAVPAPAPVAERKSVVGSTPAKRKGRPPKTPTSATPEKLVPPPDDEFIKQQAELKSSKLAEAASADAEAVTKVTKRASNVARLPPSSIKTSLSAPMTANGPKLNGSAFRTGALTSSAPITGEGADPDVALPVGSKRKRNRPKKYSDATNVSPLPPAEGETFKESELHLLRRNAKAAISEEPDYARKHIQTPAPLPAHVIGASAAVPKSGTAPDLVPIEDRGNEARKVVDVQLTGTGGAPQLSNLKNIIAMQKGKRRRKSSGTADYQAAAKLPRVDHADVAIVPEDVQLRNVIQMCLETEAKESFAEFSERFAHAQDEFGARMRAAYETSSNTATALLCGANSSAVPGAPGALSSAPMRGVFRMCFETEASAAYDQFMANYSQSKAAFTARLDASYDVSRRKAKSILGFVSESNAGANHDLVGGLEQTNVAFEKAIASDAVDVLKEPYPALGSASARDAPQASSPSDESSSAFESDVDMPDAVKTLHAATGPNSNNSDLSDDASSNDEFDDDELPERVQRPITTLSKNSTGLKKGLAAKSPRVSTLSIPTVPEQPARDDMSKSESVVIARQKKLDPISMQIVKQLLGSKRAQSCDEIYKCIGRQKRAVVNRMENLMLNKVVKEHASSTAEEKFYVMT